MSKSAQNVIEATVDQLKTLRSRLSQAQCAESVDGLLEVLRVCRELQEVSGSLVTPVVAVLRRFDVSWLEIASALGLSRQAVWDRYRSAEGSFGEMEERLATSTNPTASRVEHQLEHGRVYTRVELKRVFSINDATINNGVFPLKKHHQIWLFVTERKPADRVPYRDELAGDELRWQGQTSGRTDALIINHMRDGNDIVVFYRKAKYEFPLAGFRYEGCFEYVSHSGSPPTNFLLKRRHEGETLASLQ